jgi:hypothetical protein
MINVWNEKVIGFDEKIGQNQPNLTPYLIESNIN